MILWPEEDSQCNVHVLQVWCRMWRHGGVKGEKREEGRGEKERGEGRGGERERERKEEGKKGVMRKGSEREE